MDKLTIRAFMTAAPQTIGADQPLAEAAERMRLHGFRHLPVLDGGRLVGILSARDVALVGALPAVDLARVVVSEAMTAAPHVISPDSSLEWAAAEMAQHKLGSMIVVEHEKVVGILTTIDALRALSELLSRARRRRRPVKLRAAAP